MRGAMAEAPHAEQRKDRAWRATRKLAEWMSESQCQHREAPSAGQKTAAGPAHRAHGAGEGHRTEHTAAAEASP